MVEIPRPALRLESAMFLDPGSLLLEPTLTELCESCTLPIGIPEEVEIFDDDGSALTRLLLREKNEVDWEGTFEILDVADVIEDLRERPAGVLSFESVGFSVCLADRKPNAPREAIVPAWLATALGQGKG